MAQILPKAPRLMHFPLADYYLQRGYAVRRSIWDGTTKPLAWIRYSGGLYYITKATAPPVLTPAEISPYVIGTGPFTWVVQATDFTYEDMRARDFTLLAPGCVTSAESDDECGCAGEGGLLPGMPEPYDNGEDPSPPSFDMNAPNAYLGLNGCNLPGGACECADTGSGSGGTGTGGGDSSTGGGTETSSGGGTGGTSGSDGGGSFSSGGGGGGGSGGSGGGGGGGGGSGGTSGGGGPMPPGPPEPDPNPKPKNNRQAPSVTLSISRMSDTCVPKVGGQEQSTTSNSWSGNVTLGADPNARPGDNWFVSVRAKGRIVHSGTIGAGSTAGFTFTETGKPGSSFPVIALCYLPGGQNLQKEDKKNATFQSSCVDCPEGQHWSPSVGACVACPEGQQWDETLGTCVPSTECPTGMYWDGTECRNFCDYPFVYNPATGACESVCGEGMHWDSASNSCVSNCPEGMNWNGFECVGVCGPGYTWDTATGGCIPE